MAITPLGSVTLTADSDPTTGVELYDVSTAGEVYPIVSVIVTNKAGTNGSAYIWFTSPSLTDDAFITYNLTISGYNTYETFRFAMDPDSVLYVAGTTGLSFYVNGLLQQPTP